jgi:dihydrofolate reductase
MVFSRTLAQAEWNNTTLFKEIVPADITALKEEPGRNIVIYGSASIVQALTNLGLIDTYQVLIYPVVLGSGKPLFHQMARQVNLKLYSATTHPSGVVVLAYTR